VVGAALERFSRLWSRCGDVWKVEFEILPSDLQNTWPLMEASSSPQPAGVASSSTPAFITSSHGEIQMTSINIRLLGDGKSSSEQGTVSISGLNVSLTGQTIFPAKQEFLGLASQFQDLTWTYRFQLAADKVTLQNEAFITDGSDSRQLIRFLAWHYAVPLDRVRLVRDGSGSHSRGAE
jgi:hypothetical protein